MPRIVRKGVVLAIAAGAAASAYAGWKEDLVAAIRAAHGCEVRELIKPVEREVKGLWFAAAVAQCKDGRKFTGWKIEDKPFVFARCDAPGADPCP